MIQGTVFSLRLLYGWFTVTHLVLAAGPASKAWMLPGLGCASPKFGIKAAQGLGEPGWSLDHSTVQAGIRTGLWQPFLSEHILILVKCFMSHLISHFSFIFLYFPSWFTCSSPFLMFSGSASQKAVLAALEGKSFPLLFLASTTESEKRWNSAKSVVETVLFNSPFRVWSIKVITCSSGTSDCCNNGILL